jgi:hypothetical protein
MPTGQRPLRTTKIERSPQSVMIATTGEPRGDAPDEGVEGPLKVVLILLELCEILLYCRLRGMT